MFVAVLALALARGFLAVAEIVFVLFDFAFDARLALIGVSLLTSGLLSKMVAAAAMPISFSILARCLAKKISGSSPSFSIAANSCPSSRWQWGFLYAFHHIPPCFSY